MCHAGHPPPESWRIEATDHAIAPPDRGRNLFTQPNSSCHCFRDSPSTFHFEYSLRALSELKVTLHPAQRLAQERTDPGQGSQEPEPEAEEDYSDQHTQSQHWTQGVRPLSAQGPRYAQTHDVNAFQRALWKSRRGRPRPAPLDQARGQVPPRQPRLERIEDPVERQLGPNPLGPVPQQRQPAPHQLSLLALAR
jgi:hypothetical protein